MYDLNDFEFNSYIEGLCLANLPIDFYGKELYHINVKDLLKMGEKKYSGLIVPFSLSQEVVFEKEIEGIYLLEIISIPELAEHLENMAEALKIFFKTDDVNIFRSKDTEEVEIVIDGDLFIDKLKFEELSGLILKMCNTEKLKRTDESKEKEKTLTLEQINSIKDKREREYQLAIYNSNQKKKANKNKSMALYNVYSYVCNNDTVDYEKPLRFNIYQLYNTFNINHKKDEYKYTMRVLASGMCSDTKKLDLRPLSQQIVK